MAIPKTRSAREKNLILSPQNNPRFPFKNIFTAHSLCTSLYFGTFIVHKPLSTMHCGQISPQCFLACRQATKLDKTKQDHCNERIVRYKTNTNLLGLALV